MVLHALMILGSVWMAADAPGSDQEKFQGTWAVILGEREGVKLSEEEASHNAGEAEPPPRLSRSSIALHRDQDPSVPREPGVAVVLDRHEDGDHAPGGTRRDPETDDLRGPAIDADLIGCTTHRRID